MRKTTIACFLLALVIGSSAQFLWNIRPHPLHNQQAQQLQNLMLYGALFGIEMNEPLLLQMLQQASGGPRPMNPLARRRNQQNLGNALTMFGLMDGPDVPDPTGPPRGRQGRRGGAGGGPGGGNGGGAKGGAARARGGGGPPPAAEEPGPRQRRRRNRRRQQQGGGAAAQ